MDKKRRLYTGLIGVLVCVILLMLVIKAVSGSKEETVSGQTVPSTEVLTRTVVKEVEVPKIVEVEKEITVGMIEEGLQDMGLLITGEYYFTDAVSNSEVKKILGIELGFTESSYIATYDGVVTAGLDFTQVTAVKNDDTKEITVTLPHAQIQNTDIDPETFTLISEKNGVGTRISVDQFNTSLVELENAARDRAVEKGLLDRADKNAEQIIGNFVRGLVGDGSWTVSFVYR